MISLLTVSFIWAFSFGLIGNTLEGVNAALLTVIRLTLALLAFLPLYKFRLIGLRKTFVFAAIGAIQYGFMYVTLFMAFQYLESHEVALFTIFTPLYVTGLNDFFTRKFHPVFGGAALLAVLGTGIIKYAQMDRGGLWEGFALMQISNICFAAGQLLYRRQMSATSGWKDKDVFGALYFGAAVVGMAFLAGKNISLASVSLSGSQWIVLAYLGLIASGLAFFLWNKGARRVNAGTLAVFNNLKVPLAITVSLLVFGEETNLIRLLIGGSLVLIALAGNEYCVQRQRG